MCYFNKLFLIFFIIGVVACAPSSLDGVVKEISKEPGKLVIYVGRSETLIGPIIQQFSEVTGIKVQAKYGKTGAIAAILLEEGKRSPADVFFAQDPGGLGIIASANMLKTLDASILETVPDWAKSKKALWVGLSGRARTIVYNTKTISPEELPASIIGFTDSRWKDRIGWSPTNASFQAMVTAMRVEWGENQTRTWLKGIQANEPKIYHKNTPIVSAVATGEIDIGFVNHYYLHRFIAEHGESFTARNHHLISGGPGSIILVAGMGILTTSNNQENAERFLKFMLSPVAQQYLTEQIYEYPVVAEVKTNPLLTSLDVINKPSIDMTSLDDLKRTQELLKKLGILH